MYLPTNEGISLCLLSKVVFVGVYSEVWKELP